MFQDTPPALPRYADLPRGADGGPRAWDALADLGQIGRMGLQSSSAVRAAAQLVQRGAVFSLNAAHDHLSPPLFSRGRIRHTRIGLPGDSSFDDVYDNYYPQASSQWDALSHEGYTTDTFFQGATAEQVASGTRNTIEHWATRGIAGRGVLLDVSRLLADADRGYDPGTSFAITVDDLEAARERAEVTLHPGDVLLVHTGFLTWYSAQDRPSRLAMSRFGGLTAAGLEHSEAMAEYLWDSGAAGVASDAPGLEVWPPDLRQEAAPFGYLHRVLIGQFGLAIGELWRLDELAADCAADHTYEFLLTSSPLNVPGGIGSPANAQAIK